MAKAKHSFKCRNEILVLLRGQDMIEIERKFLVRQELLPPLVGGQAIIQGYLCKTPQIRFRIINESIIIGIKQSLPDGSRFELETQKGKSSHSERLYLERMSLYPVIEKTRYRVKEKDLVWEIDVYAKENEGLITVDVELPALDYKISFPDWVDEAAEITTNSLYFNTNLGVNPYKTWEST